MSDPIFYVQNAYNYSFQGGQEIAQVQADTLAHAAQLGQLLATAFQRPVRMSSNGTGTQTTYQPAAVGVAWAALTAYAAGSSYVAPPTANGLIYKCTVGGTSAAGAPTWPTTIGATVTDGTVTWTCWSFAAPAGVSQ